MKKIISLVIILSTFSVFSQGEANNWFFGNGAGLVFDNVTGAVTPSNAAQATINTNEGCSSISDPGGNLLFYTDGRTVWNANHQIMPNGDYFGNTGLLGDPSSTSSGLIVPKPGNTDHYYIFTVDEPHHDNAAAYPNQFTGSYSDNSGTIPNADDGFNNGLNYSLVDLTLNGGLGDVDSGEKNIHLITYNDSDQGQASYKCAEKITAVEHADGNSYWVVTHFIDTFYAFRIDNTGVNQTPVTSTLNPVITIAGYRRNSIGYMKSSPDGSKIAVCHAQNGNATGQNAQNTGSLWLYNFDNATGTVSSGNNLLPNTQLYGTEFSADSNKLYSSSVSGGQFNVTQFDLENLNNATLIHTQNSGFISAMQLAPNGKIYICNLNSQSTLDVIENPEEIGALCNYNISGQPLAFTTSANLGLPPFIQSFLIAQIDAENLCFGDTTQFNLDSTEDIVSVLWDLDDGATSTDIEPSHEYSAPGNYSISVEITTTTEVQTFNYNITIFETPFAIHPNDILVCDDNNDDTWTFDFTIQDADILDTQDNTVFTVSYFESQEDADNNQNEITGNYTNTSNPQTIYARIENNGNPECYDTTSFSIEVFNTPIANPVDDYVLCDDAMDGNDDNGQREFDLTILDASVLDTQDATAYSITYHPNQADADANSNALGITYYNLTPFNDSIFARIENNANTDCYDTVEINLIVNPIPESFNATLFQCDEDGIPEGYTVFNLTEANEDITAGNTNVTTLFYTTLVDAENSENEVDGNNFSNWLNPQIIYVQVVDNTTGCFDIAELTLEVSATSANDAILETCDDDGTEDGFHSFNLLDAEPDILDGLPANLDVTYYETYEDALLETNTINTTFTNTIAYSQTIYVRVENMNACYGISEIQLTVFELPDLEPDSQEFYCLNYYPETITLYGGVVNDLPNNYYYEWSTGETTSEIMVNEPGTYTVTVTNVDGCSKNRTITVIPSNIATIEDIEIVDASDNNTITVLISSGSEGEYEYALGDQYGLYLDSFYSDSNVFENVPAGIHTVYVKDVKNDCGIITQLVSVVGFPKFFTPNSDGIKDTWQIDGVDEQFQSGTKIYIFDRFGKLITQLDPLGYGWDGTLNGQPLPATDYWFFITLEDGRVYKNHFALFR